METAELSLEHKLKTKFDCFKAVLSLISLNVQFLLSRHGDGCIVHGVIVPSPRSLIVTASDQCQLMIRLLTALSVGQDLIGCLSLTFTLAEDLVSRSDSPPLSRLPLIPLADQSGLKRVTHSGTEQPRQR